MEVYRIDTGALDRIEETEIATEENLEQYLIQAEGAEIGGVEILYLDQQGSPGEGGIFDIVGIDYQGNVVIIELKRDRTPRDMVAQALEYAARALFRRGTDRPPRPLPKERDQGEKDSWANPLPSSELLIDALRSV